MTTGKDIQSKLALLDKYDAAYHNGQALVSDAAYDLLKDSVLRELPPGHSMLSKVGHAPSSSWPKERHDIFMGSQNKVTSSDEIRAWVRDALKLVGEPSATFVLQHKLDGFSLEVKYAGRLQSAVTRGNGVVGENITPNARMFRGLPGVLPIANKLAVRAEGIIPSKAYADLQKRVGDHYENPRNAASGISRRLDGSHSTYIHAIAYDISGKAATEQQKVEALKKLGFETVPTFPCVDADEVVSLYEKFKKERATLPYDIDGLVLKFDSVELQERAGVERNKPLGQVALKFESDQALTKILDIKVSVGRTGKITFVAILQPVKLMGSTITKLSVHNCDHMKEHFIGVGAEVTIEKRGDIIPQIVEVVVPGVDYVPPKDCPSCGKPLEDDGVNLWCRSSKCRVRDVARITYWLEVIGVKGFSEKFVDALYGTGRVYSVADLYWLTPQDVASIPGIGPKTVASFFKVLQDTGEMSLAKFIEALGIPTCARSTATLLADEFGSWEDIAQATPDRLTGLSKIGSSKAASITEGIREIVPIADDVLRVVRIKQKVVGPLTGKSFCVTGSLVSMDRKAFQDFVTSKGGTAKGSVSAGLDYLVTNDPSSGSRKNESARKLGVKVITEDEFFQLVGGAPKPDEAPQAIPDASMKIVTESLFDG